MVNRRAGNRWWLGGNGRHSNSNEGGPRNALRGGGVPYCCGSRLRFGLAVPAAAGASATARMGCEWTRGMRSAGPASGARGAVRSGPRPSHEPASRSRAWAICCWTPRISDT